MNGLSLARRRWFQFGLRTMFVVVMLFAALLGWELKFVRERQTWIEANFGWIDHDWRLWYYPPNYDGQRLRQSSATIPFRWAVSSGR
ncbi:MAG TPA: hypothetical protein VGJ26_05965 [Pirellulales bacterium]|jgi:hypothetical protein